EDTGYGVACDGMAVLSVKPPAATAPTTATVQWQGPGPGCGGWTRAHGDVEVSLESLGMLRRSEWVGRARGTDDSQSWNWDLTQLSFTSEWQTSNGECPARRRGPAFAIPKLELGSEFTTEAWKVASFDRCATTLDSAHSVALPGTAKATARLRAVISDSQTLFVDVIEAPGARPGANLLVCFADGDQQDYAYCRGTLKPDCVRVAMDGTIRSGQTVVERAPDKTRFRVQLPPDTSALTVSYVEAGGRSLSSSAFRAGDTTSLGSVFPLRPSIATCPLTPSGLVYTPTAPDPERALLEPDGLE
ncbi:MAG TPA: hypothetical protein VM686_12615, partial [Polyangiaceae bacterium]|nr:hypothetical protein [Polyangiaceae bacterium]